MSATESKSIMPFLVVSGVIVLVLYLANKAWSKGPQYDGYKEYLKNQGEQMKKEDAAAAK